jgi:CheY-like chemotaxis protein
MAILGDHGTLVLIVDDEDDLRSVLDYNLKAAGYRTVQAATGSAALQRAATHKPDIILLDLNLPDLPGTEVCRQLKAAPSTESIPIVMLTARGGEQDRVLGFELGAEDYIPKPSASSWAPRTTCPSRSACASWCTGWTWCGGITRWCRTPGPAAAACCARG